MSSFCLDRSPSPLNDAKWRGCSLNTRNINLLLHDVPFHLLLSRVLFEYLIRNMRQCISNGPYVSPPGKECVLLMECRTRTPLLDCKWLFMMFRNGYRMCLAMISWGNFTKQRSLFANLLDVISGWCYWMFLENGIVILSLLGCVLG